MFGNFQLADQVAIHLAGIDHRCRQELRTGDLADEPDYVSALSARIRDSHFPELISVFAQTQKQGLEIQHGVDGLIIFQCRSEIKIGWYEAKRPQVGRVDHQWDRIHPDRGISHFSEQIIKQHKLDNRLALWEMFLNDQPDGFESPPYDAYGSSCVWHDNAYAFMIKEGIITKRWTTAHLKELLQLNCVNFYSVIYDMISCRKGKPIAIENGQRSVSIYREYNGRNINADFINIPLPANLSVENDEAISAFMQERNIAGYLLITLQPDFLE